jgi:hypothetical protein
MQNIRDMRLIGGVFLNFKARLSSRGRSRWKYCVASVFGFCSARWSKPYPTDAIVGGDDTDRLTPQASPGYAGGSSKAQHHVSTLKLVDLVAEQEFLSGHEGLGSAYGAPI